AAAIIRRGANGLLGPWEVWPQPVLSPVSYPGRLDGVGALRTLRGRSMAATNKTRWNPQSRANASPYALDAGAAVWAARSHPRNVAHIVVSVGPPMRMTRLSVVVAMGRSWRLTDA